jgi:hypothetical protein
VVYYGPLAQQHKLIKRISLANTFLAVGAAPFILEWADHISVVSRYGLATSLVLFGLLTTGLYAARSALAPCCLDGAPAAPAAAA